MADLKDMIQGTLNTLTEKLRDADIPGKLKEADIVNKVKEGVKGSAVYDVYEKGTDRAKDYGRALKLTLQMNGETEELKRVYTEIGKLYFQENRANPQGVYTDLFAHAQQLIDSILEKDETVKAMREALEEENGQDIDVEIYNFEDVVDATESDGSDSGDEK